MKRIIAHLNQGQRALLSNHHVQVHWIRNQLRYYASIQENTVKALNVCIVDNDFLTDSGDLFLLRDNIGTLR